MGLTARMLRALGVVACVVPVVPFALWVVQWALLFVVPKPALAPGLFEAAAYASVASAAVLAVPACRPGTRWLFLPLAAWAGSGALVLVHVVAGWARSTVHLVGSP